VAQSALVVVSPVCPVITTPGSTSFGPGLTTVSNPMTIGLEMLSRKPKLFKIVLMFYIVTKQLTARVQTGLPVGRHLEGLLSP